MAIAFDAVGPGAAASANNLSWSHTAAAGAYVLVAFTVFGNWPPTVATYNGSAMTLLGSRPRNNANINGHEYLYGFFDATGGTRTVQFNIAATVGVTGNSVSYTGVASAGTAAVVSGSGTSLSQAVTCSAGELIVQAFAAGGAMTPSGGASRYNGGTGGSFLSIREATASTTFTATLGVSSAWAGIAVVLAPGGYTGSAFFAMF